MTKTPVSLPISASCEPPSCHQAALWVPALGLRALPSPSGLHALASLLTTRAAFGLLCWLLPGNASFSSSLIGGHWQLVSHQRHRNLHLLV